MGMRRENLRGISVVVRSRRRGREWGRRRATGQFLIILIMEIECIMMMYRLQSVPLNMCAAVYRLFAVPFFFRLASAHSSSPSSSTPSST